MDFIKALIQNKKVVWGIGKNDFKNVIGKSLIFPIT